MLCLPAFLLCSCVWRFIPMSQTCYRLVVLYKCFLHRCWRCLLWRNLCLFSKFILYCTYLNLLLHYFEECFTFSSYFFFLLSAGQCLLECGLPPHLVHMLLFLLAVISLFGFRKVFLNLYPTSSIRVKVLLPDEELAKTIAWFWTVSSRSFGNRHYWLCFITVK